jgi:3-hydroxybutyryl-CoA dehydrogenase
MLGAGVMGRNIARVLAAGGAEVVLFSRSAATLRSAREALREHAGERVAYVTDVADAVTGADVVLESVPESLPLKLNLLGEIERAASPRTVIATNTSSLSLDRLAGMLEHPERFLGWHWFNPAHIIPLVEVVPAPSTDPEIVRWSVATLQEMGKLPLALSKAIDGFLANRLQYALIREALALVQDGAATPEQIDAVITGCLGPRWAVIGPMRSSDLAGIRTAVAVAGELFPKLSTADRPQPALTTLLDQGRLGAAAGAGFYDYPDAEAVARERDRLLAAVLDALAAARRGAARPGPSRPVPTPEA